jgi:hypothetical protein
VKILCLLAWYVVKVLLSRIPLSRGFNQHRSTEFIQCIQIPCPAAAAAPGREGQGNPGGREGKGREIFTQRQGREGQGLIIGREGQGKVNKSRVPPFLVTWDLDKITLRPSPGGPENLLKIH